MKKMKVLALVMVFAFAALGGAYAMWYDDLVVKETVSTGVLDLEWNNIFVPDPGPNYTEYVNEGNQYLPYDVYGTGGTDGLEGLDELDPGNPNDAKNIGYLDGEIISDNGSDITSNLDQLKITLGNGYPGYQDRVFATLENVGTVPAKFDISSLNIPSWLIVEIWFDGDPTKSKDNGEDYMVWSSLGTAVASGDIALDGYQIDPGEKIPVAVYTRVLQSAPQNINQQEFTITLKAIQWNEYDFTLPSEIMTRDRKDPNYDGSGGQTEELKYDHSPVGSV